MLRIFFMFTIGLFLTPEAKAQEIVTNSRTVAINKSVIIEVDERITRISKGQPDIVNVVLLRPNQLLVQGKALGTTNVLLWDGGDRVVEVIDLEVSHDLAGLKAKLKEVLPQETIAVRSAQGRLVLSGEVSSLAAMNAALRVAGAYHPVAPSQTGSAAAGRVDDTAGVINLMHVGGAQQVMLEVTVAEVSRTLLRNFDMNFQFIQDVGSRFVVGAVGGGLTLPLGPGGSVTDGLLTPGVENTGAFAQWSGNDMFFRAVLDAGKGNGLIKVLAEPNLTTLTGEKASFLSGGEFPIPVPQGGNNNATTITFKSFGISVDFLPVVLESNRINLTMDISVSDLNNENPISVGAGDATTRFFIPSLSLRKARSSLELADGQTMSIAGLINDSVRENFDKMPWLAEVPVIGALFRSQSFQKNETELVIFVTPRLARPIAPEDIRLPTDNYIEPNDVEFYLMGRMTGMTEEERDYFEHRMDPDCCDSTDSAEGQDSGAVGGGDLGGLVGPFGHTLTPGGGS